MTGVSGNAVQKKHFRLMCAALMISLCVLSSHAATFRLFILSGQSNAQGQGNGDLLPDSLKKIDTSVVMWNNSSNAWKPLRPYRVSPDTAMEVDSLKFGPEIMFAHQMKLRWPGDIIGIVKQVRGGTSIVAWEKDTATAGWIADMKLVGHMTDSTSIGSQWSLLDQYYTRALAACKKRTDVTGISIAGFLWGQVERDCNFETIALTYGTRLAKLIGNVKQLTGVSDLPTMFMDSHSGKFMDTVHRRLVRVRDSIPGTALIPDRDLPLYSDNIHFTAAGQVEFGRRFAQAYFAIIDSQQTASVHKRLAPAEHSVQNAMRLSVQGRTIVVNGSSGERHDIRIFNCRGALLWKESFSLQGTRHAIAIPSRISHSLMVVRHLYKGGEEHLSIAAFR